MNQNNIQLLYFLAYFCKIFNTVLACANSRPSSLPARVAFRVKDVCDSPPKIPYWWRKRELYKFEQIIIWSHETERFVLSRKCLTFSQMYEFDSNFRRTEYFRNARNWWDPHGGSKPWSWLSRTKTHSTDLRVKSCRYIKLEKYKLDHIAERKILLDKLVYNFLEVKLQRLWRKRYEGKYDISSVLWNSSNHC